MTENGAAPAPPEDDRTPTQEDLAPVAAPGAQEWVMPQPVFRRSDGYTPRAAFTGNEDETVTPNQLPTSDVSPPESSDQVDASDVADQPDIAEELNVASASAEPVAMPIKKKRSWFRILLIILGIVLLVAAATTVIVMVALGYFLQVSESQNLN